MSKKQTLIGFMRENTHLIESDAVSWAMKKGLTKDKRSAKRAYARVMEERECHESTINNRDAAEQPNLFEVPSIQDILIAHARQDKLDEILDMMVQVIKSPGYTDLYSQVGCIKWASSKIKENRIAKKLLSAYKRNPSVMSRAVTEVEDFESSLD